MRVVIVDDEPDVADSLRLLLESLHVDVLVETDSKQALSTIQKVNPDLVLSDLRMPNIDGQALLEQIREQPGSPRVVLMSAYGSLDTARQALAWGADDFVSKPIDIETLNRLLADCQNDNNNGSIVEAQAAPADAVFGGLVGKSPSMRNVFDVIDRIAQFPTSVLVLGPSGAGKELVAQEIHKRSSRADGPFIPVNCGAIPESLIEAELFGYRKGAFTGADNDQEGLIRQADKGTLFLDEIGDLPLLLQVKLLRVIQEGKVQPLGASQPEDVDVRWITATLRDLEKAVEQGTFRQDLYFRINVLQLELPPLCERPGDLRLLVQDILARLNQRYHKSIESLEARAFEYLKNYDWPGNVRELDNVLERAYILCQGDTITYEGVRGLINADETSKHNRVKPGRQYESLSIKKESRRLEVELIQQALGKTEGNRTQAAKLLEISHRALLYKLKEYNLG